MTIADLISDGIKELQRENVPDAEYDGWRILAFVLHEDFLKLKLQKNTEIKSEDIVHSFRALIQKRSQRIPLQYLEGEAWFMGHSFLVTPAVLIPRMDTEILCEEAFKHMKPNASVLDIGTGSGAIAITLKNKRPDIIMTAVDISQDALTVAQKNAKENHVDIEFLLSDCFSAVENRKFDMILSNPPYISKAEMDDLMPEVCFEPATALYGGEDGLDFYRKITSEAGQHLSKGGYLLYEIGWKQREAVGTLLKEFIGDPFFEQDFNRIWRVAGAAYQ